MTYAGIGRPHCGPPTHAQHTVKVTSAAAAAATRHRVHTHGRLRMLPHLADKHVAKRVLDGALDLVGVAHLWCGGGSRWPRLCRMQGKAGQRWSGPTTIAVKESLLLCMLFDTPSPQLRCWRRLAAAEQCGSVDLI